MSNKNNQKGFTLIEVLIAVGITTLVVTSMSGIIFQLLRVTEKGTETLTAIRELENSNIWISRDIQRAETCDLIDGGVPVQSMTISWNEASVLHSATYALSGTDLQRDHGGEVTTLARNISSVAFSMSSNLVTTTIVSSPESRWDTSRTVTSKMYLDTVE